jgi:hypothetical protein
MIPFQKMGPTRRALYHYRLRVPATFGGFISCRRTPVRRWLPTVTVLPPIRFH